MPLFSEIQEIDLMGEREDDGFTELVMINAEQFTGEEDHINELKQKL